MAKMGRAKILEENKRTKTPSPPPHPSSSSSSSRRISYFINSLPLCCEHSFFLSLSLSVSVSLSSKATSTHLRLLLRFSPFFLISPISRSSCLSHSQFFDSRNDDFRDFRGWYTRYAWPSHECESLLCTPPK